MGNILRSLEEEGILPANDLQTQTTTLSWVSSLQAYFVDFALVKPP